jgi:hypothetical protein
VLPETDPDVLHRVVDLVHEWRPDGDGYNTDGDAAGDADGDAAGEAL